MLGSPDIGLKIPLIAPFYSLWRIDRSHFLGSLRGNLCELVAFRDWLYLHTKDLEPVYCQDGSCSLPFLALLCRKLSAATPFPLEFPYVTQSLMSESLKDGMRFDVALRVFSTAPFLSSILSLLHIDTTHNPHSTMYNCSSSR